MDWLTVRKKIENFWFYYKWYVIGALFLILTVIVGTHSCSLKARPDLHLLYLRDDTPNTAQVAELEAWLAPMTLDTNEDGEKTVEVQGVSRSNMWNGDDSAAMVVQVNSGNAVLYMVSETAYQTLHANGVLQDLSSYGDSPYIEGDRYLISTSGVLDAMEGFDAEETVFSLCIRKIEGTSFEGKPKYEQQQKAAYEVLKKIIEKEKK